MPEKTVTKSFRISESVFLAIEEEAKKRKISVNTLVNQLLLCYANFDRYLERHDDYAYFIEYNEVYSPGEKRIITLMHSYGGNGSIFVKTFAQALFELIGVEPKLSSTNNSVTLEI